MDESEVEGFCQRRFDQLGKESDQRRIAFGSDWLRISYERRDGWIQVQYLLFGPGGYIHSVIDGQLSRQAERWHHDVDETPGPSYGINSIVMVSPRGWFVRRMVGEMDAERGRRLVGLVSEDD